MPPIPFWALTGMYWLHMLAAVTWAGSLAVIAILVLPAARRTLLPLDQLAFVAAIQGRVEAVAWFSLSLLAATGLFQMSANPHYDGFLASSNQWSLAMLAKHVLTVVMVALSAVQTWEIMPAIRRILLRREKADARELTVLQRRELIFAWLNLALAIMIFGATAVARAS
jgi:uncharacterized membrane protein